MKLATYYTIVNLGIYRITLMQALRATTYTLSILGHSRDDKPIIIIPLKSEHVGNLFRLVPIEILLFNSFCFEATLRIVKLA